MRKRQPRRGEGGFAAAGGAPQRRAANWVMVLAVLVAIAGMAARVRRQSPNADELVRRADRAIRGRTEEGVVTMDVTTPRWRRSLRLHYWAVNPDKTFIRVVAPAKEAGIGTLRIRSNMWNYLPSIERTIKIPPSLMLESWMGSDFTNDDLVRESSLVNDYTHRLDGEAVEGGDACYRIVATAKPEAPVVWGRIVLYVRRKDSIPRREEYYGGKGKLQKVLTFDDIRLASGRLYPMRWTMVSVNKPGHQTTLKFAKLVLDRRIPDSIFTRQNLRQGF